MKTYLNPVLENLPVHLRKYVVPQHYERYTSVDQAIWRYVMRQNYAYLKDVAYYPYIPGLRKAGLSIERIPDLQEMNDSLKLIGWGAVTVDGFIPPAAFMEFQAHRVLVIAADIRQLDHIEYTPAPDIIHESSGHAPIIGEPEYAEYLQYFGTVGSKAMFSAKDFELYEAIRRLSILKEDPNAIATQIEEAEDQLTAVQNNMGEPSEMALLSRLHWWTVEYGLIGTLDNPKIYGAGLLSSIGESVTCMQPHVPKLMYSLETVKYTYDITKPQPQLFVTPDFHYLREILDVFANSMSFRVGGKPSVDKAIACQNVCTVVYSSGLQVSGIFQSIAQQQELIYIKTIGPTALAFNDLQLDGHGKTYHREGFGSPVGKLKGFDKPLEDFNEEDLLKAGIALDKKVHLTFKSGIEIIGLVKHILKKEGKILLISFEDCIAKDIENDILLFDPSWGIYDMAVGIEIVSVFSGAADKAAYEQEADISETKTLKHEYDEKTRAMHTHYQQIRHWREHGITDSLLTFARLLNEKYPEDWLSKVELLELAIFQNNEEATAYLLSSLENLKKHQAPHQKLIEDGVRLAKDNSIDLVL